MNTEHTPRRLRLLGLAAALSGALILSMIAPPVTAAPARADVDSFPNAPDLLVHPPQPCIETPVTVFVRGYVATSCDSFISAYRSNTGEIVIRTIMRSDLRCYAAPSVFFSVPIPFGLLPAGTQTVTILRRQLSWAGDRNSVDSVTTSSEISFTVRDACPDAPLPVPAAQLPYVMNAHTVPLVPCPDRPTQLALQGFLPSDCARLVSATHEGGFQFVIAPYPDTPRPCTAQILPWSVTFPLGFLAVGNFHVLVRETVLGTNAVWPPIPDQHYVGFHDFQVKSACDSIDGPLPFVDSIHVGRARPRLVNWPICPNEPYRVSLAGHFPNGCYSIRRVDVAESFPPIVRVVVDDGACRLGLCPPQSAAWDTSVVLPGLPLGNYRQVVQIAKVSCGDSIPPDSVFSVGIPFAVIRSEDCRGDSVPPPPIGCLLPSWVHGPGACDAYVTKEGGTPLTLQVMTGTPLSGLEGTLRFQQLGLRISNVEAIGPAAGMHMTWTPTNDGNARFVMFAEHGAPIPASSEPVPVVRVSFQPAFIRDPAVVWPDGGFFLEAERILGADVNGDEVPYCPSMALLPIQTVARICFERPCDFDNNGVADVRDLVRMVRCIHHEGPCPPDSSNQFDCDGNGTFGLADVLCCAVNILQGPACPECPIDSIRTEPDVRASFETPLEDKGEILVPLRLVHTDRIGAARLAIRFPSDRYTLVGVDLHESAWLHLHEERAGVASVGLIRIAPDITQISPMDVRVVVRLALKPGAAPGGEVMLEGGEMSGRDGVMLRVNLGNPRLPLDGGAGVEVYSVHPNPSAGAFRIALALAAPARLDVAVHDIAGRRLATVFQGERPAGTHEFLWDGSADGVQVRGGVYFLRASAGGQAVVKKLILLNRGSGTRIVSPARQSR